MQTIARPVAFVVGEKVRCRSGDKPVMTILVVNRVTNIFWPNSRTTQVRYVVGWEENGKTKMSNVPASSLEPVDADDLSPWPV